MSDFNLSGQVVAVTGASSGIGEATALACAKAGAAVSLAARRVDRVDELAKRIEDEGGHALAIATDVSDEDQARNFIERTNAELGRIDALVNNAGVMLLGPVEGAPTEEWRRMVAANLMGVLYCTHPVLPIMRAQGSGHIVNISSTAGRNAREGAAVYNLTKFGVVAFSDALRQECVAAGIRVTVVEPGAVGTELAMHNRPEILQEMLSRFKGVMPMQADEIADAIVYALTRPANVSINEMLIRPSGQKF